MAVPIENLTSDQSPLITISPNATLQEAVALMIENDFSQLPIVEDGKPYGSPASFVTSTSIARALRHFGTPLKDLRVRDATVSARTVSADDDLFSKMDDLLDAYAVLVLNQDGTPAGIVTNYDTTQYFRRRAEDMLLVEDIETTLKDHVRVAFGGDENDPEGALQSAINTLGSFADAIRDDCLKAFRKFCGVRSITLVDADIYEVVQKPFGVITNDRKFDDLTLSEYIQLARKKEAWAILGPHFGVPDKAFLEMLEGVRKTRNKLMHFRPDVTAVERDHLRFCAEWFKNHPPLTPVAESGGAEVQPPIEILHIGSDDQQGGKDRQVAPTDAPVEGDEKPAESEPAGNRYAPLADLLSKLPKTQERLVITFSDIESVIRDQLPPAAREHRSWWSNDSTTHPQSEHWLSVNWRVVTINMAEEKVVFARARDRERAYINFFNAVQTKLRAHPEFPLHTAHPIGANWLTLAYFPGRKKRLILSFALRQRVRLEFYIDSGDTDENARIFDALSRNRTAIESGVGHQLEWERLENRRASRIALYTEGSPNDEPDKLEGLINWSIENALRFYKTIDPLLGEIN